MRILIDGYNLGLDKGTGVATYGRNLSNVIRSLGHEASVLYGSDFRFSQVSLLNEVAFFDSPRHRKAGALKWIRRTVEGMLAPLGCRVDRIPITGSVVFDSFKHRLPEFDELWNGVELYRRCIRAFRWYRFFGRVDIPRLDIAHWTYPLPIRARGALNVYTLHDLIPLRLPHTTLDNKRHYFSLCKRLVESADHIVTVSENSRKDIINLLGADPARVTNTYQSVRFPEELSRKPEEIVRNELSGTFGLDYKGYLLFFGAVEPKKNAARVIEAYLGSGVTTPLVIAGASGWSAKDDLRLLEVMTAVEFRKRILRLEYLPLPMLVTLIRGAKATLFPSLYEGFGLPAVESMLLGTAVLTSNTSCMPEVTGDAAYFVDPYDTRALAEAIRELDSNQALRCEMETKGLDRAENFSPAACARRLDAVYRGLLAEAANGRHSVAGPF